MTTARVVRVNPCSAASCASAGINASDRLMMSTGSRIDKAASDAGSFARFAIPTPPTNSTWVPRRGAPANVWLTRMRRLCIT